MGLTEWMGIRSEEEEVRGDCSWGMGHGVGVVVVV
jgi:hypothetical protein